MPKIPKRYANQPELVETVVEARKIQMETNDNQSAIEWLIDHHNMSLRSANRVLDNETFQYTAFYPEGHPGLESLRKARQAQKQRTQAMQEIKPQILAKNRNTCQSCKTKVSGKEAILDHKDPQGPETFDNLHILCRRCHYHKGKKSWEQYQEDHAKWEEYVKKAQEERKDFTCENTGLSVRGRTWKEAGCDRQEMCRMMHECGKTVYEEYKAFEKEMDDHMEMMFEANAKLTYTPKKPKRKKQ